MTTYRLTVALAETSDGHFPYLVDEASLTDTGPDGQRIVALYPWSEPFVIEAESVQAALDRVYAEANIGTEDWAGRYREGQQRSLSVGDVVRAETEGEETTYWQVISHWSKVDADEAEALWRDEVWDHEKSYARKKALRQAARPLRSVQ